MAKKILVTRRWRLERRDCQNYYGDGGCLHKAACKDLPVVPCRGCRRFAPKQDEWDRLMEARHYMKTALEHQTISLRELLDKLEGHG